MSGKFCHNTIATLDRVALQNRQAFHSVKKVTKPSVVAKMIKSGHGDTHAEKGALTKRLKKIKITLPEIKSCPQTK